MTMSWLEFLLIGAGISLDIFAAFACQGALIPKIHWRHLVLIVLLAVGWQVGALSVGRFFGSLLYGLDTRPNADRATRLIAAAIFILLGIRMLWKAKKDGQVEEIRQERIPYLSVVRLLGSVTLYTMLTGFAIGFLSADLSFVFPIIACSTALAVGIGVYVGYRFGPQGKYRAYLVGGIMLLAVSADVVARYVLVE